MDFMDDEDLGEFGIAPQRVQTTEDFTPQEANSKTISRKRKMGQSSGPIPGVPVLHHLLQPAKDNVAIRLLKKMGWKVGQGIGARQTRREKKAASERNARELYVMKKYGCDLGPLQLEPAPRDDDLDSEGSDLSNEEITFAPDDFEPYVCGIKDNTFGLGYIGLSRKPVLKEQQHIDLFGFETARDGNKKLPIRGQAFGVGALEEEDEDIYERDDMTKYDFSLEEARKSKPKRALREDSLVVEGFHAAQSNESFRKKIFSVPIPSHFRPRNWAIRRSRFEPLDESRAAQLRQQDEHKTRGLGRHDLNPDERGSILGEVEKKDNVKVKENKPEQKKKKSYLERINEKYKAQDAKLNALSLLDNKLVDKFAKGEVLNVDKTPTVELDESAKKENEKVQAEAVKITKSLDKSASVFKPFINNQSKQERYEKFLEANLKREDEIMKLLATVQPLNMSEWDREMEMKEFLQARNIYKPLKGSMSDRFVSEAAAVAEREILPPIPGEKKKVEIHRTKIPWKPSSLLCKRFDLTTLGGAVPDEIGVRRSRFSVFDYVEASINTKDNFVTPVIRPTKAEKPKLIIQQPEQQRQKISGPSRISTKELFVKEVSKPKEETPSISQEVTAEVKGDQDSDKNISSAANPSSITRPPVKEQTKKTTKAKSDLEKKVEESINKHPSEKKDLFKAIFDSSSEDEDEEEKGKEKPEQSTELSGNTNISQEVMTALIKPTDEINILRSTSPPKGLFANLFKAKKTSTPTATGEGHSTSNINEEKLNDKGSEIVGIQNTSSNESSTGSDAQQEEEIYGPKIPKKSDPIDCDHHKSSEDVSNPIPVIEDMERKFHQFSKKSKKAEIVEEWVEKSEVSSKERKKKKKEKDKDKKKKSKKHKKEKKKQKDKK